MKRAIIRLSTLLVLIAGVVVSAPVDEQDVDNSELVFIAPAAAAAGLLEEQSVEQETSEPVQHHHRVRRGQGHSGYGIGNTVVDGISVWAVSGGNNAFVSGYTSANNFLASSGQKNYLAQQGGLQGVGAASHAAGNAGFSYDHIATGKYLPSNVAGYNGFPSYGR